MSTVEREFVSCTDTAKLIRAALRREFPGVRFSVRSDKYAGGASIHVEWTDGPTPAQVEGITHGFQGGRFDGMIDMATYVVSWLEPDGTAHLAHHTGTEGQRGSQPERIEDPRNGGARMVHFGADYVFTNRSYSDGWLDVLADYVLDNGRTDGRERCAGCGNCLPAGSCFTARGERDWVQFVCSPRCGARVMAKVLSDGDYHGPGCDGPLNCTCDG